MIVWFDGSLRDSSAGLIDALDHGITVGDGVFETCELRGGRAFALTRHLQRLDTSAEGLGLPTASHDVVREAVAAVESEWVRQQGEQAFGRLRITWTGGLGPLGSDRTGDKGTLIVAAGPAATPAPAPVRVVPWTRNERSAVAGLKTTSYAENARALAFAHEHGDSEAIFANTRGDLCEGTGSNVFIETGNAVLTPPLDSGCLAGITRALVLQWAADFGVEVREQTMPLTAIAEAEHAALSSSVRGFIPISSVDGRPIETGPLTATLHEQFARRSAEQVDP